MKRTTQEGWALIALAIVPLIGNWPIVVGWLTVDPIDALSGLATHLAAGPLPGITALDINVGVTTQALGHLAAADWLSGRVPWWNPYDGIGLPLSAEGQNQALFLPFVLLLALRNGPFLLLIVLQEVAAFATYGLLRRMDLSRAASWTGAALFCVNGTFAWFGHGPIMPVAFAPLLLLGIEMEWRAIRLSPRNRSCRGWMVAAAAVALSLYAGFIETAYLDSLLAAAWSLTRIVQCRGSDRIRFIYRLALASVTGMLLAAPFIVPFASLLGVADISVHTDVSSWAAPHEALPLLVMPHALGPEPFGAYDPSQVLLWLWGFVGGYASLPVIFLATLALVAHRGPNPALRWVLAAWIAVMIGATFGVPGIARAVYSVPGLAQVEVFRYSAPSWELAAAVLASHTIDDWRGGGANRKTAVGLVLLLLISSTGAAVAAASRSIAYLRAHVPHYDPWLFASVGEAVAATLFAAALLANRPAPRRVLLLAVLLACDSLALFTVPRMAGLRDAKVDADVVAFLKTHLGLQRMYSMGVIQPNYSAFFELASINADYLPTPLAWARHVRSRLDPWSDANAFTGDYQFPGQPHRDHRVAFLSNLPAYRDLAVRYVLVPAGQTLDPAPLASNSRSNLVPMVLANNDSIEFNHIVEPAQAGSIESVLVTIGTFNGNSDGDLAVTACVGERCESGVSRLPGAVDDAPIEIPLNTPLPVGGGSALTLRFTHSGATRPVALWMVDRDIPVTVRLASGVTAGPISMSIGTERHSAADRFRVVYADPLTTIYEVPDAAPYFEIDGGPCTLTAVDRETVTTACATPARLIRRELFFKGWTATIGGRNAPIVPYHTILQAVEVPSGVARIEFHYVPPLAYASFGALILGVLILAAGISGRLDWL